MSKKSQFTPPSPPKRLVIHEKHGDKRKDEYFWLNNRENPEVIDYLHAENEYCLDMLEHTENFQDQLFKEITGRIQQTDMSVPYLLRGYWYYSRFEEKKEYPIYARKKETLDAKEEILLDVNLLAAGKPYCHVGGLSISPDNQMLAYGVDFVSRRQYTIRILDLSTGTYLPETFENTTGSAVWAEDNRTLFFTVKDETLRPSKIFRHQIGSDPSASVLVFHERDESFYVYAEKTKSDKYILIACSTTVSSEYWYIDAADPFGEFKVIHPRERDLEYRVYHMGEDFFIITNYLARNFRLVRTPFAHPAKENWVEVIPNREDVLLESIDLFHDFIAVGERSEGIAKVRVISWDGSNNHLIDFGEDAYVSTIGVNPSFDTGVIRVHFTSMSTPPSVYDYDVRSRTMTLLKQQEVLGGFNPADYHTERIYALADDGTRIPISLMYKKRTGDFKPSPLLMYGYGSYGISLDPGFSSVRLSLVDRGFVYAIAHIRGGEEMGRHWYENGKLLQKWNTFNDFIRCAEHLIEKQYTRPDLLCAMGGSAGGLLIGTVINARPDLFRAVIAAVPFVDVMTTMLDETIPLTTGEYDEWGNPNDPVYYHYMRSYSPYDNVKAQAYPAILVTTGLHDSQVQYWEPAKWVAKLRDYNTSDNPILLNCNMDTGHGGASGRFAQYRETAMEFAFFLDVMGIHE